MVKGNYVNWNNVNDVLPPSKKKVLCVGIRGGIFIGSCIKYDNNYVEWTNECGMFKKVLYWTELPLTPMQIELIESRGECNQ